MAGRLCHGLSVAMANMPNKLNLFHKTWKGWRIYKPHSLQQTVVIYKLSPEGYTDRQIPDTPATPDLQNNQIIITLPIATIQPMSNMDIPPNPRLLTRLMAPPHQWETSLWYKIWPHKNLYQCHGQLAQGKKIIIVSDASVNHKGHGTVAWIIHSEQKLWSGEGIASRPPLEMYSGLAEAYGVYMALSFLAQYTATFPIVYQLQPQLYICCNNSGVIDWLNQETQGPQNPNQTITDDYGVFNAILETCRSLSNIQVIFLHIMGHQDQKQKNAHFH